MCVAPHTRSRSYCEVRPALPSPLEGDQPFCFAILVILPFSASMMAAFATFAWLCSTHRSRQPDDSVTPSAPWRVRAYSIPELRRTRHHLVTMPATPVATMTIPTTQG